MEQGEFESCQMWKIADLDNHIQSVKGRRRSSVQLKQKLTQRRFFCPKCNLYFDTIDNYYIHRAQVMLQPEVYHQSLSHIDENEQAGTALGITLSH